MRARRVVEVDLSLCRCLERHQSHKVAKIELSLAALFVLFVLFAFLLSHSANCTGYSLSIILRTVIISKTPSFWTDDFYQ
jgi:hypothetical protein